MSDVPVELFYTSDHEWIRLDGDECVVGITDHAQDSLGDVTFVELPSIGETFDSKEVFGVVESVKAASDLFMPVAGEIIEVNEELNDSPESELRPIQIWLDDSYPTILIHRSIHSSFTFLLQRRNRGLISLFFIPKNLLR